MTDKQKRNEKKKEIRNSFWSKVGKVDEDVLSFIINPSFAGQPTWPGLTQVYKVVRTDSSVIITTDGLSDEFSSAESANNGLGIEIFLELTDPEFRDMSVSDMKRSWAFQLVYQAAFNVVRTGAFRKMVEQYGVFSTEFYDVPVTSSYINSYERVGVLIGMKSDNVPSIFKFDENDILCYA